MSIAADITVPSAPQPRELALWSGAAILATVVHAAVFFGGQAMQEPPQSDAFEQALTVDLAPLPMTTPEAVEAEEVVAETPNETIKPETAEPVEQEVVEEVEEQILEPVEPETVEPEIVETEVAEAEPIEPVEQADIVDPELETPDIVMPEVVAALPQPRPVIEKPKEKPVEPVRKPKPVKKKEPPAKRPAPEKVEKAEKTEKASKSSQSSKASKAPSISPARWQSRVLAWINRHKRYPNGAKSRREEGVVQVAFAINASGSVVAASVARSSGNPELDRAAVEMVRRASPVPAPPPEIASGRMSLSLPVHFNLR